MKRYYRLYTDGIDSNIQLYALVQAQRYWISLSNEYKEIGEETAHLHERCVFVIATIGLSVSQLLGQNDSGNMSERVGSPLEIWKRLSQAYKISALDSDDVKAFIDIYDACRHFGITPDRSKHARVSALGFNETERWYEVGHRIWELVIAAISKAPENDLAELVGRDIRHIHENYYA